jgi:hypothetical protein
LKEPCIPYYNGGAPTVQVKSLAEMVAEGVPPGSIILVAEAPTEESSKGWQALSAKEPELAAHAQPLGRWIRWFAKPTRIVLWNGPPPGLGTASP